MKVFLLSALVAVVLAVGTWFVLSGMQETTETAYTTTGVRLDDHATN